jgi:pSer/pThr/pTyr-binding forkhead associated (FHA) protein
MQLEHGGQRISVAAGDVVIGSAAGAALELTGATVLPRHAVVRLAGGHLVVEPGTPGAVVRVNGSPIGADPTPLLHGDRVGIGPHEIIVTDPARSGATRVLAAAGANASGAARAAAEPVVPRPTAEVAGRLVSLNDGREYRVEVVPFVLGRDAAAQIVIGSPDASRHHAEIVARPDGDVLVDLSANGTFVNGQRVSGRQALKALDVVRIGAEEFRYYPAERPVAITRTVEPPHRPPAGAEFRLGDTLMGMPSPKPPPAPPPPLARPLATLRVKSGGAKGERFRVKAPVVNIGRGEFNDIRITDPSVSASHAKLQLREGVWTLTDLGSTNGTAVDGLPVTDEVALSPGAIVTLGEVAISFEPEDEKPRSPGPTTALPRAAAPNDVGLERSGAAQLPESPTGEPAAAPRMTRPVKPEPAAGAPTRRTSSPLLVVAIIVLIGALAALVFLI